MNKFVCTALVLIGLVSTTSAQVALVPKAGLNLARIAFDQANNNDTRTRGVFVGGIGVLIGSPFTVFSLQPEVLFSQKGYQRAKNDRFTVNYIEIPVMGRLSLGSNQTRGYLGIGPSYGFAIGGKNRGTDGKDVKVEFGDGPGETNRSDWGLQFGLGLSQRLGIGALQIEGRYGLGLSNISSAESHNRVISFTAGYAIPIRSR
ncbi:porin family protein [Spirosoma endbachense]|uniref:Outer membrane beta-barrel protein n=1 Tax=Spirosoma endbachense TaxID=2666025 RepID=A0A6P1W806_9BACT|nr:porin family protein [Spirosoma endbachense]QHW00150.1 outer membrane beta-barrel protein [Spirosoma endbachense]